MCRILYLPPGQRHGRGWLTESAAQLDKSQGGHGIGWYDPIANRTVKGLTLKPAEIVAKWTPRREALLHFRLASAGGQRSELCHPFKAGKWGWLVHNGHWGLWNSIPEALFDALLGTLKFASDTARIAQMVARSGPGVLKEIHAGVFLLHGGGDVRIWKSWGAFGYGETVDGAYFASEQLPGTTAWRAIGPAEGVSLLDTAPNDLPEDKIVQTYQSWAAGRDERLPGFAAGACGRRGRRGAPFVPLNPPTTAASRATAGLPPGEARPNLGVPYAEPVDDEAPAEAAKDVTPEDDEDTIDMRRYFPRGWPPDARGL
jgi:hypothetical protein